MTPGLRIGKYEVGARLGKGSFGVVHLARDVELGREVAIKFLRPEFSQREQIVQRFLQEARAAAKIGHPGIVTVFECGLVSGGRSDGTAYIVMERLLGDSLGDRVTKRAWSYSTIIALGRQLAIALHAAHAAGIIHRDLKPDNVFLVPDAAVVGGERAKILDFGIAKLDDPGSGGIHTHSKMILGTPRYMSPEQARSSTNVDARTDVYALGCMLYELVCGRAPFEGDTGDIMFHHQATDVPPASSLVDNVPAKLDALLRHMLQKQPDKRPANMLAVDQALASIDPDDTLPVLRNRAKFVDRKVVTDIVDPPRPKRISAAGELSTKAVEDKPPQRESDARVKVDFDAVPSPSEEHTAPSQKVALMLRRASEPTFRVLDPTEDASTQEGSTERDPVINSTLATRRGPKPHVIWLAAAGGVLVLLAIAMIAKCGSGATTPDAAPAGPDAAVVVAPSSCKSESAERNWPALERCARDYSKFDATKGEQLLAIAVAEAAAERDLRAIAEAEPTGDLESALRHDRAIGETSVYRPDANRAFARVKTVFVDKQVSTFDLLAARNACLERKAGLEIIERAFGADLRGEIEGRAQPCVPPDQTERDAARPIRNPPPRKPDPPKPPKPDPKPPKPEPTPASCTDPRLDEVQRRGDDAMQTGSYATALTLFEFVYRCRPTVASKAYVAACKSHNFPKAKLYFKALGKESFAQICLKEGYDPRQ